jgi:hypothetical protein
MPSPIAPPRAPRMLESSKRVIARCLSAQRYRRSAAGARGSAATDAPVRLQRLVRTTVSENLTRRQARLR